MGTARRVAAWGKRCLLVGMCIGLLGCAPGVAPAQSTASSADELVFYDWEDEIPAEVFESFRQEFNIRVRYETYASMEEAVENIRSGQVYDVVNLDFRFLPGLMEIGMLAEINSANLPNFRNISPNFRELAFDPHNRYSVPYNYGTTGMLVRSDLLEKPMAHWSDLLDPGRTERIALNLSEPREVLAVALKSLGYAANSENTAELENALRLLIELAPRTSFPQEAGEISVVSLLEEGKVAAGMGYGVDYLDMRERNDQVGYILPEEGPLIWYESLVIPASSRNQTGAEALLNYLLRPQVSAQIANYNRYATPNEMAWPLISAEVFNNPVIFPPYNTLRTAEIITPLSAWGEGLYASIWERYLERVQ